MRMHPTTAWCLVLATTACAGGQLAGDADATRTGGGGEGAGGAADAMLGGPPALRDTGGGGNGAGDSGPAPTDARPSTDLPLVPDVPAGACAEGEARPCGLEEGACRAGMTTCAGGRFGPCVGAIEPVAESCNGTDDDCDGVVDDELFPRVCPNQSGVCAGLVEACAGAAGWQGCGPDEAQAHDPRYRVAEGAGDCDGVDNDCDGTVDDVCACADGATQPCGVDVGACRSGMQRCVGGQFGLCDGIEPVAERCDGIDNDCDGTSDEGCECLDGAREACGANVGACRPGARTCTDGHFGPCDGIGPAEEQCNGVDDDCDGQLDDGELCGGDEDCVGGRCVRNRWVFEAEGGAMGHDIGRREGDGWSCSTLDCGRGMMVYGPYTRELDAGAYTALFRMRVDNVVADNNTVARLEVNDFDGDAPECGDCVLESRDVRRREFPGPMQATDIAMDFVVPVSGHRMEFRTYFTDISYVWEDRIEVRRR